MEHGLFDKPTVLNNVETFRQRAPHHSGGAEWFQSFGTAGSPGTKAFALTGNIENTGLIEVPMGTTLREIIFDIGGGIKDGKEFKAVQIGGPSGGCLIETNLDLPLDFDSLKKVGGMIGSGGLVVMDDSTCMVEVARFFHELHPERVLRQVRPLPGGHPKDAGNYGAYRGRPGRGGGTSRPFWSSPT